MNKIFLILTILLLRENVYCQKEMQMLPLGSYDSTANPELQLKNAINEASATQANFILDVGGEWCIWCHRLDTLFLTNPDLTEYLKNNFVLVKINFSKENENEQFLGKYPKIAGYPHFFVLETDGTLLHSQNTGDLEKGKGHDRVKVMEFLTLWRKPKK